MLRPLLNRLQQRLFTRRLYSNESKATNSTEDLLRTTEGKTNGTLEGEPIVASNKKSKFDFIPKPSFNFSSNMKKRFFFFFRVYKWLVGVSFFGKQYDDAYAALAYHRQNVYKYAILYKDKTPETLRYEEFEAVKKSCYGKLRDRMVESLVPLFVFDDMMVRIVLHKNK